MTYYKVGNMQKHMKEKDKHIYGMSLLDFIHRNRLGGKICETLI